MEEFSGERITVSKDSSGKKTTTTESYKGTSNPNNPPEDKK